MVMVTANAIHPMPLQSSQLTPLAQAGEQSGGPLQGHRQSGLDARYSWGIVKGPHGQELRYEAEHTELGARACLAPLYDSGQASLLTSFAAFPVKGQVGRELC